jgi:ATP-dependent helicase HrpA
MPPWQALLGGLYTTLRPRYRALAAIQLYVEQIEELGVRLDALARSLPHAETVVLRGQGHNAFLTAPDDLALVIAEHARAVLRRTSVGDRRPSPIRIQPGRLPSSQPIPPTPDTGPGVSTDAVDLRARLPQLTLRDERRLRRRLDRARRRDGAARADALAAVAGEIDRAEERVARRRAAVPSVTYPSELPIAARIDDLTAAIRDHQVVVVAGETGSGKTTQLPKVCLELGRGVRGMIGHTQPRRIAARTVADRIADELGVDVGGPVGYEFRFNRRIGDETLVSVMTDGILLASIQSDPAMAAYDTLIIDEAHERSLTIDFLIGYVVQLLPRRPDLKVIITSATIDPERFSRHFDDAPIVEVSGRMYPVEVRYRPLDEPPADDTDDNAWVERDQTEAIADAVTELWMWTQGEGERQRAGGRGRQGEGERQRAGGRGRQGEGERQRAGGRGRQGEGERQRAGDILVFLSGEREIRDTADALADLKLADTEILPLYSRLATAQQRRVFQPHTTRRIVLATNVAETSLTVPGIRYVIDPGYARISRYSARLKVQRLPIEKISQASADQRKGRCGRTADGVCIRLYSEEDFEARPRFTEPEVLRTNLASVLLQMAALGLGDIARFPFLDPPDARQVRDGLALLHELGAIDPDALPPRRRTGRRGRRRRGRDDDGPSLTPVGRTLARLPVDPRLGRMLIEADRNACLEEVTIIAAALSIPDPRQRPTDERQAADALHARFAADGSDFLTWLNLWSYLREQRDARSGNQFRKLCRAEHLHYLRIREWQDLVTQLRRVTGDLDMHRNRQPAEPDAVHRSLLAGLLSHIGVRDGDGFTYRGARGATFAIQPGSVLFKGKPEYVMAAELVETSRLWARIRPQWAEEAGAHLVVRQHGDPHWSAKRGTAVASERVTLYGVPLVADRTVDYAPIDPPAARELLIRHALVGGAWHGQHAFWRRNAELVARAEALEDRLRRRDVVIDDEVLFAFYDARIGAEVTSIRAFDGWWKTTRREQPHLLDVPWELLVGEVDERREHFPDHLRQGDLELAIEYRFDPGTSGDGLTVLVPVTVLNRVDPRGFAWLVPGLRDELVVELLRALPKATRRELVPIPDTAKSVVAELGPVPGPLPEAMTRAVQRVAGITVSVDDWRTDRLPNHLRARFKVVDGAGRTLGEGEDLPALQRRLAPRVEAGLTTAAGIQHRGMTTWDVGAVPRTFTHERDGHRVEGYPALVDEGDSVALRVLGGAREQQVAMWTGTRRLLLLSLGAPVARVARRLDNATKLTLSTNPHGGVGALLEDAQTACVDELMRRHGAPAWNPEAFAELERAVRGDLDGLLLDVLRTVARIVSVAGELNDRLAAWDLDGTRLAVTDMTTQLRGLVHAGFISAKGVRRLGDVERYLRALRHRMDTLARDPERDRERTDAVAAVTRAYRDALCGLPPSRRSAPDVLEIPWMIEELRVGLFAQSVGTAYRVSPERVQRAIAALTS